MMNLKEIRESYEDVSGKLSAVIRQINFAGIAVVWIFVDKDKPIVDQLLLNACLFIVVSIVLDALLYFISTIVWHVTYICKHKVDTKDEEIAVLDSEWKNAIPWLLLYSKCIVTGIGYYYILCFFTAKFQLL